MASYHLSCLLLSMMFMALTFSIIWPDFALDLWHAVLGVFKRRRVQRLARKSKQIDKKMKKYWVIDMRKLR